MDIKREIIKGNGFDVPSIVLTPTDIKGAAVVVHGYGGCKEEQLGLAYSVAEMGFKTYTIDLRGHGEHDLSLDEKVILDVEAVIEYCKSFGKVVAIGHSLGGRLALISSADYSIGISPALGTIFGLETQGVLKKMRGYRVRELFSSILMEVMKKLPVAEFSNDMKKSIIYGERDVPEIMSLCNDLKAKNFPVIRIDNAMHSDIFTFGDTFEIVKSILKGYLLDIK